MSTSHLSTGKYHYSGDIYNNLPHRKGIFRFFNNDVYDGECYYGKMDGFGIYTYADGSRYSGFFSYGKTSGIGTFENIHFVQKGTWRADRRHGVFYCTVKGDNKTYRQTWIRDILISQHETQYMSINALQTTKVNLQCDAIKKFAPLRQTMCLGCSASPADVAIVACGHVCVCVNCVAMCTQCPICRVPIGQTLKLFIS